jgi:hypothetical protein
MTNRLPIAEVVHAMSGRSRLRIAGRRGDAAFFASVAGGLSTIPGVHKVEVRPLTGSILIQHGPPLARIGAAAEKLRLFVVSNAQPLPPTMPALPIDPKIAVGVGLGALALWQLVEGRIFPPAITLAWYASNLTGLLSDSDSADGSE